MTIHFTADLHLDHDGVLAMSGRLFRNILEHDEHMIDQINRYVGKDDKLFILGDVAWHSVDNYLDRLVCKDVHLIWGNHDRNGFGKKFKTAEDVAEIKIGKKPDQIKVWLSHYAHAYWPSSHYGSFHLYGHTHRQREETLDKAFPGRRSMDVGVDNARHLLGEYRPFSEHDIVHILGDRPGHDLVEFYEDFQSKLPKYQGDYTPGELVAVEEIEGTHGRLGGPGMIQMAAPTGACPVLPEDKHADNAAEIEASKTPASAKEVAHKLNDFFRQNGNYEK